MDVIFDIDGTLLDISHRLKFIQQKPKDWKAFRTIKVNGEEVDFSDGFTDLHTKSYEEILGGNGFKLEDAKPALDLVHKIRNYKT